MSLFFPWVPHNPAPSSSVMNLSWSGCMVSAVGVLDLNCFADDRLVIKGEVFW